MIGLGTYSNGKGEKSSDKTPRRTPRLGSVHSIERHTRKQFPVSH